MKPINQNQPMMKHELPSRRGTRWTLVWDFRRMELKPCRTEPDHAHTPDWCEGRPVVFRWLCFRLYIHRRFPVRVIDESRVVSDPWRYCPAWGEQVRRNMMKGGLS